MPVITINHRSYRVDRKKPLLDSLLERGEQLPYSCRSGVCHACMLKVQSGKPPEQSQNQLNHQQKSNGYFLACQCHPSENMSVSLPVTDLIPGIISGKTIHSPTTATLEITPKFPVGFMPGQQLTVQVNKQLISNVYPESGQAAG